MHGLYWFPRRKVTIRRRAQFSSLVYWRLHYGVRTLHVSDIFISSFFHFIPGWSCNCVRADSSFPYLSPIPRLHLRTHDSRMLCIPGFNIALLSCCYVIRNLNPSLNNVGQRIFLFVSAMVLVDTGKLVLTQDIGRLILATDDSLYYETHSGFGASVASYTLLVIGQLMGDLLLVSTCLCCLFTFPWISLVCFGRWNRVFMGQMSSEAALC